MPNPDGTPTQAELDAQAIGAGFADRIRDLGERSPPGAVSPAGARSAMQVMPATAAAPGFGVAPARSMDENELTRVGRDYAQALLRNYGGNTTLASAAYNAGPGRVDEWLKEFGDPRRGEISAADWAAKIPIAETRNYVARVTGGDLGSPTPTTVPQLTMPTSNALALPAPAATAGNPSGLIALALMQRLLPAGHGLVPVEYDPFKVSPAGMRAEGRWQESGFQATPVHVARVSGAEPGPSGVGQVWRTPGTSGVSQIGLPTRKMPPDRALAAVIGET